jgi:hypothetical protein
MLLLRLQQLLLLQNKNLLSQKSTASKQQEKADETKDTHTPRRELERRQQEFTAHRGGARAWQERWKELIPTVL